METTIPTCACGRIMTMSKGVGICGNCDHVQPREIDDGTGKPAKRLPTLEDRRYALEWERRKREHYGAA